MPFFRYKAKDKTGKTVKGVVETASQELLLDFLYEKKYYPISIVKTRKNEQNLAALDFLNKVKPKDLVLFSRQLSVMKSANLPLVQSLRILEKQTDNLKLKTVIADLADEVDGGARLSEGMQAYPGIFSDFFVSVIRSGETSGRLDEVLNYLADQQEKDYDLMSKIKGAMIYPIFVISGLVVVGIIMMVVVIPKLTAILTETGQELPLATKLLIGTSNFLQSFWWLLIILGFGAFFGLKSYSKTKQGGILLDFIKIRLPVFGKLFKNIYIVRFTRSMATLLSGGVTLVEALKVTADVVSNAVYKELINNTVKEVEDGNPISNAFVQSKDVPVMISHMMSVGEKTGHLDKVLERLTDFYSREIDNLVTNLVSLIEPLIMVVLGVAVGIMVAAIIMPMYNMAGGM